MISSYRDLLVWQKAMDLIDLVYASSGKWPQTEQFGLASQLKRATVSVAANFAEGHGRNGRREYVHHLGIARGSLCETETLLLVASRQRYLSEEELGATLVCASEMGRMLVGLLRSLE